MNLNDGNARQITNYGNKCSSIIFSPDGKKLFFVQRWYENGRTPPLNEEIFSINVDGTDLKQLTHARNENAHNNKVLDVTSNHVIFLHVVYIDPDIPIDRHPNDNEVWQMAYDGSAQRKILGGGMTNTTYADTKVLPDGKSIVFVDDSTKRYSDDLQIKEIDDSGEILRLTNGGMGNSMIAVSPDGKYVAYMLATGKLRIIPVDGKESWTIGEFLNR